MSCRATAVGEMSDLQNHCSPDGEKSELQNLYRHGGEENCEFQ